MTSHCPLCENNKSNEALFCDPCTKKIHADYEIKVPITPHHSPESSQSHETHQTDPHELEKNIVLADESDEKFEIETTDELYPPPANEKKSGIKKIVILASICLVLLIGGLLMVTTNSNSSRSRSEPIDWNYALQTNTIAGFETFIQKHPFGQHTSQAIENIRLIRQRETDEWEAIRETNNIAVLQDFIQRFPTNPHVIQARGRIELLTWERSNPPTTISPLDGVE